MSSTPATEAKAFPGATYGGVKEKDINLAVALKLGALIEKELPQIKVVYTRKTDTALGKTLNEDLTARANIANKAGGDFFISIHANAVPGKPSVAGAETIIMGESEKETRYNEDALYNNNKDELIDMSGREYGCYGSGLYTESSVHVRRSTAR